MNNMVSISYDIKYVMDSEYKNTQHSRVLRKNIQSTNPAADVLNSVLEEILQELRGVRKNASLWRGCDVRNFVFTIDFSEGIQWDENTFFAYCTQHASLDENVLAYISLTGNHFFSGEAIWGNRFWGQEEFHAGEYAAFLLAMRDKKHIKAYILHLCDSDLDHEVYQADEIELLIKRWGLCEEIVTLLGYRATVASGQFGQEQLEYLFKQDAIEENQLQGMYQEDWKAHMFEDSFDIKTFRDEISEAKNLSLLVNAIAVGSCYKANFYLVYACESEKEFYEGIRYRYEEHVKEWFVKEDSSYQYMIDNLPQSFLTLLEAENKRAFAAYIDEIARLGFQKNIE